MSDQPTQEQPSEQPSEPQALTCGICQSDAVETFEGFWGAPDVFMCMNCGAYREGEGPWADPFAF